MENREDKRKKVICDLLNDDMYVPMKEKELVILLQVAKEDRDEFKRLLDELLMEGKIYPSTQYSIGCEEKLER